MKRIARMVVAACLGSLISLAPAVSRAATIPTLPKPAAAFDIGTLHVERFGSGAHALIFIPGLASGPWSWGDAIAHFSPQYTVYALTLNGFDGRAYASESDPFASFATNFWALLDREHLAKPVVIGHSLGGTLAFALAEAHPDRLAGIVALDGLPVFPAMAMMSPAQREAAAAKLGAQVASETHAELLAYNENFMKTIGTLDMTLVEPAAQRESTSDPKAVAAWAQADFSDDLRPRLSAMTLPALELMPYAPGSPYTKEQTLAFYRMLVAGAPQMTVAPIDGAKHFAMLDRPAAVNAAITQFLATAAW